jgi:hypothetical protein
MSAIQRRGASTTPIVRAKPVVFSEGALEAAKWIALVAMTFDHVNTYLLHEAQHWMYQVGRLAMPLFGIVLAAHLAGPGALERDGRAARMSRRLLTFALLAQIPFTLLRGGPWPPTLLNTMFLLQLVVVFLRLRAGQARAQRAVAWIALVVCGAVVEFWWVGAAVILCTRSWLIQPCVDRALATGLAFVALCLLTMSAVPLLAPCIVWALDRWRVAVPRLRHAFYVCYPLHFAVLLALSVLRA